MRFSTILIAWVVCVGWVSSLPAEAYLSAAHPKYKVVKGVYDDLVRAIGDGRSAPVLRMSNNVKVAVFWPDRNMIEVEEAVYDLCTRLGADSLNALAAILGHELAHFYKDHKWVNEFGNAFADLHAGKTVKSAGPVERVKSEIEADYFGGFYGYLAGYNTLGVTPRMLDSVYTHYNLGENLLGYPSLPDRQEIATRSETELRQMIPVFEAANQLMLVGRYEEAARCFDHIAQSFPSREILNNAGVARALEALTLFDEGELPFVYPFVMDADTRLRGVKPHEIRAGFAETKEERRTRLLEEAKDRFESARERDPNYATAQVNLAAVYHLLGDPDMGQVWATKAARNALKQNEMGTLANALIVQGIIHAAQDETDEALAVLNEAKTHNEPLATINLARLQPNENFGFVPEIGEEKRSIKAETIAGHHTIEIEIMDPPDVTVELPAWGEHLPAMTIYTRQTPEWEGLFIDFDGENYYFFLKTPKNYPQHTARGIQIGDPLSQLQTTYGNASRIVTARQGTYHIYEKTKIIFDLDEAEHVRGWTLFRFDVY
ncbi:MAG: hypothetical protein D6675_13670 [Gemmatimonadetes bacterium]|nr:MAG: hypothetical protein D6675_13670 [Gemmatimonadota bacterium]